LQPLQNGKRGWSSSIERLAAPGRRHALWPLPGMTDAVGCLAMLGGEARASGRLSSAFRQLTIIIHLSSWASHWPADRRLQAFPSKGSASTTPKWRCARCDRRRRPDKARLGAQTVSAVKMTEQSGSLSLIMRRPASTPRPSLPFCKLLGSH
jgi:hypothetical protein